MASGFLDDTPIQTVFAWIDERWVDVGTTGAIDGPREVAVSGRRVAWLPPSRGQLRVEVRTA